MNRLLAIWHSRSGASAPEYAVILGLIGAAVIVSVLFLSGTIGGALDQTSDCIAHASVC